MARLRTAHTAYQATSSLGQENGSPTWAAPAGPHIVSCPSSSNGHARNPAEQNQRRRPRLNPSVHFPSPSLSSTHAATSERPRLPADEWPSARRGNGPVTPSWAPRRRARPPLGGRAVIERPHSSISPRALTDEMASAGSIVVSMSCVHPQAVHRWDLEPDHAPASGGSGSTRSMRRSAADGGSWGENK
jgi:hypothetical protein